MVMGRKEVAVDFITRLKDKGFKDLDKATKKSQSLLTKFGKGLGVTFGAVAIGAFVKKSVNQFATLEKSTKRLESELTNLGLAFATTLASDFTRALSLSSGVSQNELNPALQKLIQTTYTLTDAQKLLSLSTEISRQKGLDLTSVSNALSRAFVGDYKALVQLRIGYEKAELKGKEFAEVLKTLEADFSSKQPDTFADKINKLKVAFEQTQVAVGTGFVQGLEKSGLSIEETQEKMIALGEAFGTALGGAVGLIDTVSTKFNELANSRPVLAIFDLLDRLAGIDYGDAGRAADAKLKADLAAGALQRKALQDQAKLTQLAKVEAGLAKLRAAEIAKLKREELKRAAEKKRSAELDRLRNAISFKFDIDAINLQAALRRNLSKEDRDRVLQLSALKIADYQVEIDAIKTLQAATTGRYDDAMNLEMVFQLLRTAGYANDKDAIDVLSKLNPSILFKDNLDEVKKALQALIDGKYVIKLFFDLVGTGTGTTGGASKGDALQDPKRFNPGAFRKKDEDTSKDLSPNDIIIGNPDVDLVGEAGGERPISRALDVASFRKFEETNDSSLRRFLNKGVPSNFDVGKFRFKDSDLAGSPVAPGFDPGSRQFFNSSPVININVSGSVLAQNDLVAAVTDAVYQTQRSGNQLVID